MRKLHGWAAAAVLTAAVAGLTSADPVIMQPDKDKPAPKQPAAPPDKPAPAPDKASAPADKPAAPADKPAAKDKEKPATLQGRIAADTKLTEEQVNKVLTALGPAVREQLTKGSRVDLPGLGVLRVVRVAEHRDLVDGRPALIPASNYVEFTPTGNLVDAANAATAVPADVVLPFQYNPLPGQTPSQHVPDERTPGIRTR